MAAGGYTRYDRRLLAEMRKMFDRVPMGPEERSQYELFKRRMGSEPVAIDPRSFSDRPWGAV